MENNLYETLAERWIRPGGTVWIYSDTHFSEDGMKHLRKNYIGDNEQVKAINSKVGKNDTIIFLGDVGNLELVKKIRGYKVLIMGNHEKGASNYRRTYTVKDIGLHLDPIYYMTSYTLEEAEKNKIMVKHANERIFFRTFALKNDKDHEENYFVECCVVRGRLATDGGTTTLVEGHYHYGYVQSEGNSRRRTARRRAKLCTDFCRRQADYQLFIPHG